MESRRSATIPTICTRPTAPPPRPPAIPNTLIEVRADVVDYADRVIAVPVRK